MTKKQLGYLGQKHAEKYLENNNYKIKDVNWTIRGGEIDIVCEKNNQIIFIEVKTQTNYLYGKDTELISYHQQKTLIKTTLLYMQQKKLFYDFQIDLIVVEIEKKSNTLEKISHFEDVVEE